MGSYWYGHGLVRGMIVRGRTRRTSRRAVCRKARGLVVLAMIATWMGVLAPCSLASGFHQLVGSATSFASDGARYAAWQVHAGAPIVVLDTLTGHTKTITAPTGCGLIARQGSEGEPSPTAVGGRFLLDCETPTRSQEVLDVRTGNSGMLPTVTLPNGTLYYDQWERIGARYVEGTAAPEECSDSAREHESCIALFDLATGAVSYRPPSQVLNLDLPGAPQICPALRGGVLAAKKANTNLAYGSGVFAHLTRDRRNVQVDRCSGHATVLPGPSGSTKAGRRTEGEPSNFELGGGLLTWDTGHSAVNFEPNEETASRGTLTSYSLSSRRLRTWKLPRLSNNRGQDDESPGVYGYSAHTANAVFWIATRTLLGVGQEGVAVGTSSIYAAPLS
jgi:hypothetical protein